MATYTTSYYPSAPSVYISGKAAAAATPLSSSSYYPSPPVRYTAYAASPPETTATSSLTTRSGRANSYSVASSSSYAASVRGEYDAPGAELANGSSASRGAGAISDGASAAGLDLHDYMQDRLVDAFDPLPLDRAVVTQAQASGLLNAKNRELLELQQIAQQRLARLRARLPESMQHAKDVQRDLEWTSQRMANLKSKAARRYPQEYRQARARYPSPE